MNILATQYTGVFIGPIAKLLGYIMNWVYLFLSTVFGIENIGLAIILFTLVIYLCLLPLTVKQQKFSVFSQKMQPELKAIQKKYEGRKDQESMMAMNQETQAVYKKYGVSPSGSCIQLIIQMPILFALYRVIYNVPAYVSSIKAEFTPVVEAIMGTDGYQDTMTAFFDNLSLSSVSLNFDGTETEAANSIIDVLYKMPSSAWATLKENFAGAETLIDTLKGTLDHLNYFLGINITNSPMEILKEGWANAQYLLVIGAILIPVLSAGSQYLNIKLMPTSDAAKDNPSDSMASSMKTMNLMMPLISFVFVLTLPVGMGIYWIAGAAIRCVQQVVINQHIKKIDLEALKAKNLEKAKKKRAKKGIPENAISSSARMNTRNISEQNTNRTYNANSLSAKANLVKDFNERNNRKE